MRCTQRTSERDRELNTSEYSMQSLSKIAAFRKLQQLDLGLQEISSLKFCDRSFSLTDISSVLQMITLHGGPRHCTPIFCLHGLYGHMCSSSTNYSVGATQRGVALKEGQRSTKRVEADHHSYCLVCLTRVSLQLTNSKREEPWLSTPPVKWKTWTGAATKWRSYLDIYI